MWDIFQVWQGHEEYADVHTHEEKSNSVHGIQHPYGQVPLHRMGK